MIDYEQMYYDLFEYNKIKKENNLLNEEVNIYKNFIKNKTNKQIIESLIKYIRKDKV
jgi:hypothetical protein